MTREVCIGSICGEEVQGHHCGPEVAAWLQHVLGLADVQLVRGARRQSSTRAEVSSSLANDSSCLLLSEASVVALEAAVRARCERQGEDAEQFSGEKLTQRFRGNIVVAGAAAWQAR